MSWTRRRLRRCWQRWSRKRWRAVVRAAAACVCRRHGCWVWARQMCRRRNRRRRWPHLLPPRTCRRVGMRRRRQRTGSIWTCFVLRCWRRPICLLGILAAAAFARSRRSCLLRWISWTRRRRRSRAWRCWSLHRLRRARQAAAACVRRRRGCLGCLKTRRRRKRRPSRWGAWAVRSRVHGVGRRWLRARLLRQRSRALWRSRVMCCSRVLWWLAGTAAAVCV
mmetsp:Transcript_60761/g.180823  ORF Transcript_60761/g.180823 Transcript_60761/m.180823 type:complete len:222 (+) Transcript_60761:355-1020(+)